MLVAPQLSTETSRGAGRMRSVRQDHEYVRVCIADNPLLSAANFEWRMLDRHLPWRYSKFGVASFPGGLASAEIGDGSLFRVRTGGYLDPVVSLANQGVATDEVWVLTPIADLLYAKIIVAQRFPLTAERFESCDTRGD